MSQSSNAHVINLFKAVFALVGNNILAIFMIVAIVAGIFCTVRTISLELRGATCTVAKP